MFLHAIGGRRYSAGALGLFSLAFGLIGMLSLHIHAVPPRETAVGQVIWGTAEEVTFSPFTLADVLWLFLFSTLSSAIILGLSKAARLIARRSGKQTFRLTARMGVLLAVVMVVCWLPYMLTWFPGGLYSDTIGVVNQAYGVVPLSNQHTLLYTFEWKVCLKLAGYNLFLAVH